MLDLLLITIFSIFMVTPITYSFILLLRTTLKFPSFYTFQLLMSCITLIIWTVIVIPIYIAPDLLSPDQIVIIEHFSTIIGSFGVLFFIFFIINTFPHKLVIIPRTTIVGFTIIIGSKFIQLQLSPNETLYGIRLVNSELVRVTPSLIAILIVVSYTSLYISLIFFIRFQNNLPSYIVAEKIKLYSIYSLIIMSFGILAQGIGTIFIKDAILAGWMLLLSRFLITIGFIFITMQLTQNPILSFSEKGNPAPFIKNGIINWLLIGNRNFGPESLINSSNLENYFSKEVLQLLSVKLMTSISLGRQQFTEELCIIPHRENDYNFTAIGFSFLHNDETITDERKNGKCELIFSIIIPHLLLPFLENLTIESIRGPIISEVKKTNDLKQFINEIDFNMLTVELLRNLTTKKSF